jgi:sulfite reductase beta subunit-like hemoprotein
MELTPTTIMHACDGDRQVTTKQNIQTHIIQVVTPHANLMRAHKVSMHTL